MKRSLLAGGVVALAAWSVLAGVSARNPAPGDTSTKTTATTAPAPVTPARKVEFNRDVRPIITDNCLACHGSDDKHRKGEFRLDVRASATGAAKSGKLPIVAGKPDESELIKRILSDDPDYRMPHKSSGKKLTESQKATLRQWIADGAEYQDHWSFIAPTRPPVPQVTHRDHVRNAIDAFVIGELERQGFGPATEADRRTLIRRVTLDLTGLPPTPAEAEAFVADTSADAYEKVVDRLLASPQYGEHMARFWLDAARYGDTHGLHLDNYREMWPYRDTIVKVFNANMPWDQFVIKNMAGDQIAAATLQDQVLSGFNRCHVSTNEGGSIVAEVEVRNVVDRVATLGEVFLGLTTGCAVCHDHKFDPITAKDFYSLYAFFNSVDGNPMDGNAAVWAPVVKMPTADQEAKLADLNAKINEHEERAKQLLSQITYQEPELPRTERKELVWIDDDLPAGVEPSTAGGYNQPWTWVSKADGPVLSGERSMLRKAQGLSQHYFQKATKGLGVGPGDLLFAYVYIDPMNPPKEIMLQWHTSGWKHRAYWGENAIAFGADNTTERRRMGDLPKAGEWVRLEVPVGDVGISAADVIVGWAFTQQDGTAYWDKAGVTTATAQEPIDYVWIDDQPPQGAQLAGDGTTWQWVLADGGKNPVSAGQRALRRSGGGGLNQDYFTGAKPLVLHAGDVLFAHVYIDPSNPAKSVQLQFNNGNWEHRSRWGGPAYAPGAVNGADSIGSDKLPEVGKWVRLEVPIEQVGLKPGDAINGWAFSQVGGTVYWDQAGVRTKQPPDDRHLHSLAVWIDRAKADKSLPKEVQAAAVGAPNGRTPEQEKTLRDYYVQRVYAAVRNQFDPINAQLDQLDKERDAVANAGPTTLVMKDKATPVPAFLLKRGEYDKPDKELGPLPRATPAFLPPMPEGAPLNRLGLAQWLVHPSHPLMARVTVNRFWLQCFGSGLVETADDFGTQGSFPSHPELLDWLAVDFRESGWDVKRLMKMMVMSGTYRQSSMATAAMLRDDPKNRLLARGPRYRLDAEMLRDQSLFVAGLMNMKMGGPGVKPPQPAGLWEAVGYVGSNTDKFSADAGREKVHRRSIYTFWKRTAPPPQMSTFDSPSRESCSVRRERTNTPLQALLLMNDPQYVEAARSLAQRTMREGGATPEARIHFMFTVALARPASADERSILLANLHEHATHYQSNPDAAKALIAIGDKENPPDPQLDPVQLASYTMVANLILNLDEYVCKN